MPLEEELFFLKASKHPLTPAQEKGAATLLLSANKGLFALNRLSVPYDLLFEEVPDQECRELIEEGLKNLSPFPHIQKGEELFLPKIASFFESLSEILPELTIENKEIPFIGENTSLTPSQRRVIEKGFNRRLSLIVGGPGTGKTFTAGVLLSLLGTGEMSIGCAAPTGKAAERLKESLLKASNGAFKIESRTLHSLLGIGRDPADVPSLLPHDLLIIDEASMIDPHLFVLLLKKIPPKGRLLLLGDPDQLPPIDGGSFFSLLAEEYLHKGWTERLEASHRTGNQELLDFAEAIRKGDIEKVEHLLPHFLQEGNEIDPSSRILSPIREGTHGVEELNKKIFYKALHRRETSFPILLTKNAPANSLWNGEIGTLLLPKDSAPTSFASLRYFPGAKAFFNGKEWSPTLLPPFDLSYALTIHKAQGSEEDRITLLLPEKAPLTRALLYTAVTRAKKKLTIIGSKEPLLAALKRPIVSHRFNLLF